MLIAEESSIEVALFNGIPIRNIWILMLYASDLMHHKEFRNVGTEGVPDEIPEMIAQFLCAIVSRRLKRNLSFGYVENAADLTRVRGRIDMLRTKRHQLLVQGRVACRFEELTADTPTNQYVRDALDRLSRLSPKYSDQCRKLSMMFRRAGVTGELCATKYKRLVQQTHANREDVGMLAAAKLAFEMSIPTQQVGKSKLFSPDDETHWLRRLFERALAGFYKYILRVEDWDVRPGKKIRWPLTQQSSGIKNILPQMQTDIVLSSSKLDRVIVVDAKFTSIVKKKRFENEGLSSAYLYQIYGYIRSQEHIQGWERATGVLVHPSIGIDVNEAVEMSGHTFRFMTVDLTRSASDIRNTLLSVVEPFEFV